MKKRNLITIIGAGILFVLCLVAVVWAVFTAKEPGFIEDAPQWEPSDFPLTVCAQTYRSTTEFALETFHREAVEEAISRANSRLGDLPFGTGDWAFHYVGAVGTGCRITVVLSVPVGRGWLDAGGHSEIVHRAGRAEKCNIVTANTGGAGDLTVQVIYHELGHCLGLAHDAQGVSIMQPLTEQTPSGQIPDWFSDFDREIVRDRYHGRTE